MKVVISGYYGFGNTGDEAILESLINGLKKGDPEITITVLSADPAKTSAAHHVNAIGRHDIPKILKALKGANAFISGGGGLLQDSTGPFSVIYYLSLFFLAKLLGCRCAFLGQGFGPVKGAFNRFISAFVLNTADVITVRDEASLEEMMRLGIRKPPLLLAADLAFLFEKPGRSELEELIRGEGFSLSAKGIVGVSIRKPVHAIKGFHEKVAAFLDSVSDQQNCQVLLIPFEPAGDGEESLKVLKLMKTKARLLTGLYPPEVLLKIISRLDCFIGMRFHSLVFAAISHVPLMGISYDPKVSALLKALGSPELDLDFTIEEACSKLGHLMKNGQEEIKRLEIMTASLKEKARLNFSAFSEYANPLKEISLFGIKINNLTISSAVSMVDSFVKDSRPHFIATPNPEIITAAQKDPELRRIINSADLCLPDGMGVLAASKLLGMPLIERVTGIDLMMAVLKDAKEKGYRVFFLGSARGVAQEASNRLPGVNVVGAHHGYFGEHEEKEVLNKIKLSRPDILFVGLGAPRQELWAGRHYKGLGVPATMVIGGSLDVLSGRAKRAPDLVQKLGIEWLYRLAKEPKRIKRQMKLMEFALMVAKRRLFNTFT